MPDMGAADAFMEIFGFTRAKNKEGSDMKRYAMDDYIEHLCDGPACNADMVETADGGYVRYDVAQAEIETAFRAGWNACEGDVKRRGTVNGAWYAYKRTL